MWIQKDNRQTEIYRILLQFALIALISLLLGICFSRVIGNGLVLSFGEQIKIHFFSEVKKDELLKSIAIFALYYSIADLLCISAAFLSTFSVFNYLVSNIILFYKGFSAGLSLSVLYKCVFNYEITDTRCFTVFTVFKIIMLTFMTLFLYGITLHSFDLKTFLPNNRFVLNLKAFLFIAMYTVAGCCTALILNGAYCFVILML